MTGIDGTEPKGAPPEDEPSCAGTDGQPAGSAPPREEPIGSAPPREEPAAPDIVDVHDLDWAAVRESASPTAVRHRLPDAVEAMERVLERAEGAMLFDGNRELPSDRAIVVPQLDSTRSLWFIGDLHGDLLALEAALSLIRRDGGPAPCLVMLGDLFDDAGFGLEVLVRVFELVTTHPGSICVIAGNHDEALRHDGTRFSSSVTPSDFSDFLNANIDDEWVRRAGLAAIGLFDRAPRALFLPDGLFVAHGGIPLTDLHDELHEHRDWNDPRVLQDFVWTRAHARARRKIPNRTSRGSQFGYEDFAAFCALATELGRPIHRMVRGHDHEEARYSMPPAYGSNPILTTVAMSRRLQREVFGPDVRVPTCARWSEGTLPQVYRLHIPEEIVREMFATDLAEEASVEPDAPDRGHGGDEPDSAEEQP